jgi:dolichol kinase
MFLMGTKDNLETLEQVEQLEQLDSFTVELRRKFYHLLPGFVTPFLFFLIAFYFDEKISSYVMLGGNGFFFLGFAFITYYVLKGKINDAPSILWSWKFFYLQMVRDSERGSKEIPGQMHYFLAATLVFIFCDPVAGLAGIMISSFGDGLAALVGQSIGKHKWPWSKKTIEGSITFVVASSLVLSILLLLAEQILNKNYFDNLFYVIILVPIIIALIESLPFPSHYDEYLPIPAAILVVLMNSSVFSFFTIIH